MIGQYLQMLALGVVFALGIASIMATSPPVPDHYFQRVSVQPEYRCPGTDVLLRWGLNEPAPVAIMVDGREYPQDAETGRMTVTADILDRAGASVEVALQIDAVNTDYPQRYRIETLVGPRALNTAATLPEGGNFEMLLLPASWDDRIRIVGIEIGDTQNLVCKGETNPMSWRIAAPSGDRLLRSTGASDFERIEPGLPPGGVWRLFPQGEECRPAPSGMRSEIKVRLTAECS